MNRRTRAAPSRFAGRARVVARALGERFAGARRRMRPHAPQRILVAHHLLLGDTLMLTPLLSKLRTQHPEARIVMALSEAIAPLYARAPYGVHAIGWNPREPRASPLWREHAFDLALIPGDNRISWLAAALGSRWIVAFSGDRPPAKNWPIDELRSYPQAPAAWADIVATLVDGPAPPVYSPNEWPEPPAEPFELPPHRYAVLHVGASTPLKQWAPERWQDVAAWLVERGVEPVWSAGRGEEATARTCAGPGQRSYAGTLSLAQLWRLLANAALLVAPDTGVAHLGRIVGVPTVALFGPGSATICGAGEFWRNAAYRAVTIPDFPCRDQHDLFKRDLDWVRQCSRPLTECPHPRCMDAISVDAVKAAITAMELSAE